MNEWSSEQVEYWTEAVGEFLKDYMLFRSDADAREARTAFYEQRGPFVYREPPTRKEFVLAAQRAGFTIHKRINPHAKREADRTTVRIQWSQERVRRNPVRRTLPEGVTDEDMAKDICSFVRRYLQEHGATTNHDMLAKVKEQWTTLDTLTVNRLTRLLRREPFVHVKNASPNGTPSRVYIYKRPTISGKKL